MLAPFILQIGTCILEDGTGTLSYRVQSMSFPEPEPDGHGGYANAVRTIRVKVQAGTPAALSTAIATLRQQCVRGNHVYFAPRADGDIGECVIREASVTEDESDPIVVARGDAYLTVVLETTPKWLLPWTAETDVASSVTTIPGHFDIAAPAGQTDSPMRLRIVPAGTGTGLYIGVKPDPQTGYDYLDDYGTSSDTSDANALGTYKKGAVADATLSEDVAAPTIDTNDNRGLHIAIARMDSTATTATSNTAKLRVSTTGNAIATTVTADEQVVTFSTNDLIGYEMGTARIPAGAVPNIDTGTGWSAEGVVTASSSTTDSGTLTLTSQSDGSWIFTHRLYARQTFTTATRMTAFEYTVDTGNDAITSAYLTVYTPAGTRFAGTGPSLDIPYTVGTHKVTLPVEVNGAGIAELSFVGAAEFTVGLAYSNGVYSGGALTTPYGSGESAGDDLTFRVYGREKLGFNSATPILVACSESSKTIALDYVQRIPSDYACLAYRLTANGDLSLYYDGDTNTPYVADADGIGPAVLDKCEIRSPLQAKPGVVNRVVVGMLRPDAVVVGATVLTYALRPAYLTAAW